MVTNFKADTYRHIESNTARYKVPSYGGVHVASGWLSWRIAAGLLALLSRQFARTITDLSASHELKYFKKILHVPFFIFLPERRALCYTAAYMSYARIWT